jgi:hypothetical protein
MPVQLGPGRQSAPRTRLKQYLIVADTLDAVRLEEGMRREDLKNWEDHRGIV